MNPANQSNPIQIDQLREMTRTYKIIPNKSGNIIQIRKIDPAKSQINPNRKKHSFFWHYIPHFWYQKFIGIQMFFHR